MTRIQRTCICAGLVCAVIGMTGCGSDSGSSKQQQRTAVVTFSTVSSAHSAPLEAIQMKLTLPAGATVGDIDSALAGTNDTGAIALKSYTAQPPSAAFTVLQANAGPIKFGSFARLTCTVAAGTTLDEGSFTIRSGDIQMHGMTGGSTIALENQIPARLSVSFGY